MNKDNTVLAKTYNSCKFERLLKSTEENSYWVLEVARGNTVCGLQVEIRVLFLKLGDALGDNHCHQ